MTRQPTTRIDASNPSRAARTALRTAVALALPITLASCHDDDNFYSGRPYDIPNSVVIADMNADGRNDLAVAFTYIDGRYPNAGYVGVILQSATTAGTFERSLDSAVGYNPSTLAVDDLDGVSGPDVAVANANSASVSVLLQSSGTGQLQSALNVSAGNTPFDVALGTLNNDAAVDMVVADFNSTNAVLLLQNTASPGTFLPATTIAVGNRSTAVAIGDINGDAASDIAIANQDSGGNTGRISIFLNDVGNTGVFTRIDTPAGTEPIAIKIRDVDSNGLADLIVANEGPGSAGMGASGVTVILQTAPGTFSAPVTYAAARGTVSVAVGDVNNDGVLDLVTANRGGSYSGTISVLLQDATRPGVFFSAVNYFGVYGPLSVDIGDLNGDGRNDIAAADGDRATVMFQSTVTPGSFGAPVRVGY